MTGRESSGAAGRPSLVSVCGGSGAGRPAGRQEASQEWGNEPRIPHPGQRFRQGDIEGHIVTPLTGRKEAEGRRRRIWATSQSDGPWGASGS